MKDLSLRALCAAPLLLAYIVPPAAAEGADPEILVTGQKLRAPVQAALDDVSRHPGNVSVVAAEEFADRYAVSFRETLALTPGVIAQPRFGEEVRLSIRGSGLSNNAHLRGVELVFDGVPINGADGFGDFQELDPLFTSHLIVHRGANAFSVGAATLGGAIAFEGLTARGGGEIASQRAEGGSFGTSRLHTRLSTIHEGFDVQIAGTWQKQDGFRDQAKQENGRVYANIGWRWSERVETRFGLLGNDVNQEIPGSLTIEQLRQSPRLANPSNVRFDFARDINAWRGYTRTRIDLGGDNTVSFGAAYTDRWLYHPISVVVDQYVQDAVAFAQLDGVREMLGVPIRATLGARVRDGRNRGKNFAAIPLSNGRRGALIGNAVQEAGGFDAFGEIQARASDTLTLIVALNYLDTRRDFTDRQNPARSDKADFQALSPKIGAIWSPRAGVHVFANYSESYEPPTFGQLTQSGVLQFTPIAAQEGKTLEIGTRGAAGRIQWDVALYDAHLQNEFVTFTPSAQLPATTRNAGATIHRGIEMGLRALLKEDAMFGGDLSTRLAWTHNDFRFDGDATYGDNRLPSTPENFLEWQLALAGKSWRLAPTLVWADDTMVDYANTLASGGYTLLNLEASFDLGERATVFVNGQNLTDAAYAPFISAIADGRTTTNTALYTPGDGVGVFAGVRVKISER